MKTAIFGGTFDPIHKGHLILAENAYRQFGLDQVLFMPAPNPPHKTGNRISPFQDRFEMVRMAIAGRPGFAVSDLEERLEGLSYTARTLTEYHRLYPEEELYLILGADAFYEITGWYHPEVIMDLAGLITAVRSYEGALPAMQDQKRFLEREYDARVELLEADAVDISSSMIRECLKKGEDIREFVPEPVCRYISEHGLYR